MLGGGALGGGALGGGAVGGRAFGRRMLGRRALGRKGCRGSVFSELSWYGLAPWAQQKLPLYLAPFCLKPLNLTPSA